jgi:hypothetical protein
MFPFPESSGFGMLALILGSADCSLIGEKREINVQFGFLKQVIASSVIPWPETEERARVTARQNEKRLSFPFLRDARTRVPTVAAR